MAGESSDERGGAAAVAGGFWRCPARTHLAYGCKLPAEPHTISYVEALDGGDPRSGREYMDRLMRLEAPFTGPPVELIRTRGRMAALSEQAGFIKNDKFPNIAWLDGHMAWVEEIDFAVKRKRIWKVRTRGARTKPELLLEFNMEGNRAGAGVPMLQRGGSRSEADAESAALHQDGDWVYLSGRESNGSAGHPFLDRFNLKTHQRERVFASSVAGYDKPVAMLGRGHLLMRYENESEPPNFHLLEVKAGSRIALTHRPHPAPMLKSIQSQIIQYTRADGVPLSAELCLPIGYEPGQKVPVFMWTYPEKRARDAGDRRLTPPNPFTWSERPALELIVRSLSTQGYAVLWYPSMPIIGDGTANDTVAEQMVANARAAVEKVVGMGIADRSRIGIGGHSYGGTMTGVLLANSDLFAAGIAVAGGFNFTNHPMGFASEPRALWQAPQVYQQLSSLLRADKISAPMLLIHGEQDNTYVTPPGESKRMYEALNSLGKTARHVLLPYEGHSFVAKESIQHAAWEINNWLDSYLKPEQDLRESSPP